MAEKFDPPVEIDLGANPQRIVFNTTEEADNWIKVEVKAWGEELVPPEEIRPMTAILSRIIQKQRGQIQAVVAAISAASSDADTSVAPEGVHTALGAYQDGTVLHSESVLGRKTIDLISSADDMRDKTIAHSFLGAAIRHPANIDDFRHSTYFSVDYGAFVSGIALYRNFLSVGDEEIIDRFDDYREQKLSNWEEQLALHQNEHFDVVEEIKDKKQKITDEHTRQETEFDELKDRYETQFSEFEEFYKEGLRTKAPVKYWQSKSWKHSTIGALLIAVFVLGSVIAAIYGFQLGSEISDSIRETSSAAPDQAQQSVENAAESALGTGVSVSLVQLAFSKFLVLLVPGFFAVWVLRILLKVALNNLAIADDARHRVTMVETFLSMMEHTDKLDEADRILMLQALFRPLPGSNDDDTGPPNWFDVMMQQVKRK